MGDSRAQISFVLPLKVNANPLGSDLERVKRILLPSFIKFFNRADIARFLVLVPAAECAVVSRALAHFEEPLHLSVWPEEEVLAAVPGWRPHRLVHSILEPLKAIDRGLCGGRLMPYLKLGPGWSGMEGWIRQQWIKLAAALRLDTEFYMTLDADLCLTHPADARRLIPGGRAIMERDCARTHFGWWTASAELLGMPLRLKPEDLVLSVTPELLSVGVVRHLLEHLGALARRRGFSTVFEYIASRKGWTEYTLYWLFLLEFYRQEDYYAGKSPGYPLHFDGSVWGRAEVPDFLSLKRRVDAAFQDGPEAALFIIIQSACIPMDEYVRAVQEHLA